MFILFFFVWYSISVVGQERGKRVVADSLYKQSKKDIKNSSFDTARSNIEAALEIYKKLNDEKAIGHCNNRFATVSYRQGELLEALSFFEESIIHYKNASFEKGIASSYNNMGAVYYYLGNYPKAINNYKSAAKIQKELNFERQAAATTKNIGGIYLELNDFDNALAHFQKAKKTYERISDEESMYQVYNGIGEVSLKQKKYSKAQENLIKALNIVEKYQKRQEEGEVLFNLGRLHRLQKDNDKALFYYKQSFSISNEVNNLVYESNSLIAIGLIEEELNKHYSAIKNCKEGLEIAEELNVITIQEEACKCLYKSYKSINQTKKALLYNEKMHTLKDSLHLKETSDKILNMEFKEQMLLDSVANVEKRRKVQAQHQLEVQKKEKQRNIFIIIGIFMLLIAGFVFSRLNYVKKSKKILQIEKDRSEHLLLNILPEEIAEELKEKGSVDAQDYSTVAILFTDFKSFTETASKLSPQKLVEELNVCFKAFDNIMEYYNIEKIKTIGDAYMAAGGLPKPGENFIIKTLFAAIEMQEFILNRKAANEIKEMPAFEMRVGIHVGPIVAGIVGVKKFQYDIWGDTVNIASRMESNGSVGKINISQNTYLLVKDEKELQFEYRGKIEVKGKGAMDMYFVSRVK